MRPIPGTTYLGRAGGWSSIKLERRLVLDATKTHVFYEVLPRGARREGTMVSETEPRRFQIKMRTWKLWAKTAEIEQEGV